MKIKISKQQLKDDHKQMNWFRHLLDPDSYANPEEKLSIPITSDGEKLEYHFKPSVRGLINFIRASMHHLEMHTDFKES